MVLALPPRLRILLTRLAAAAHAVSERLRLPRHAAAARRLFRRARARARPWVKGLVQGPPPRQLPPSRPQERGSSEHSLPSLDGERPSGPHRSPAQRRPGGTFTPAAAPTQRPSRPIEAPPLTEEALRLMQYDGQRRKEQAQAHATLDALRGTLGRAELEKLAALPRGLAPEGLLEFRAEFPEVPLELLHRVEPVIALIPRDVCDRVAAPERWTLAEQGSLIDAVAPEARTKVGRTLEVLTRVAVPARLALLRIPRTAAAGQLESTVRRWNHLAADDVRAAARALAQFSAAELQRVLDTPMAPPRLAPKNFRG